jgi:putative FmdB family regulatory protein
MPTYDYVCADCGPFRLMRPMGEYRDPGLCPDCGTPAPPQLAAPRLADMNPTRREAQRRNERSANEPKLASAREKRQSSPPRSTIHASPAKRPWMIGH